MRIVDASAANIRFDQGSFEDEARRTGRSWPLAAMHRCRGILAARVFEAEFEEAIGWHRVTPTPFELARTELAYGERLRRNRRRIKARTHLRSALAVFERLGAEPWTHRARQELTASGESARRGDRALANDLTPHEIHIAILVASGSSNKDTASRLFVSPRTIDAHLGHIYRKLDIHSRDDLAAALAARGITESL